MAIHRYRAFRREIDAAATVEPSREMRELRLDGGAERRGDDPQCCDLQAAQSPPLFEGDAIRVLDAVGQRRMPDAKFALATGVEQRAAIGVALAGVEQRMQRLAQGEFAHAAHRLGAPEREEPRQRDVPEQRRQRARPTYREPREDAGAKQILAGGVERRRALETE